VRNPSLHVANLLEGSARRSADRVRFSAEHDLGDAAGARQALADCVAKTPYEYYPLAAVYARQRKIDAAFAALERAHVTRDPDMDDILGQVADFSRGRLEPLSV